MKTAKKLLALLITLSLAHSALVLAPLTVSAAAPVANCTVTATEHNAGTDDYYIGADITFTSNTEFIAGLFTVEAADLTLTDCTVKSATGGDAPKTQFEATTNKVIFTGFNDSAENDFRSYTSLTLSLKFKLYDGATSDVRKVAIKNITLANFDEVKFVTADAEGTAQAAHNHTVGDTWEKNEESHWKVCAECQEEVDKAAHTYDTAVTEPTCTDGGYTTYTCTVCGYSYVDDETLPTDHTLGDWLSDVEEHWHVCAGCSVIMDKSAHMASDWIVDTPATTAAVGHMHKECTVCGRILEEEEIPKLKTHTPGDINKDGKVNNKDLTRLFQKLSGWNVEVDETALDVNGDGKINNKDLTRLFQYLSGWQVEIF